MRQKKIVASRFLTSKRFAPAQTKSIEQRVKEFTQVQTFTSIYPFSPDYAVKAAMGGRNRNAAADNKEKRKKDSNLRRLGIYCYDPKAKKKPNQYFETRPRFNLDGLLGDVPNIGWIDPPKTVTAENYNQEVVKFLQSQTGPKIIARPAKMNKRTGQLNVKALGPSIGGTVGNLGQAAARAIGIIIDANGRMRCPPGVPAANQFTDDIGSNCFDFTPAIGRAVMKVIQNVNEEIFQGLRSINQSAPTIRGGSDETLMAPPAVANRIRRGLASATIKGPTGELLGPDGRPLQRPPAPPSPEFVRDVEEIRASAKKITPDMYEEEFDTAIRAAFPDKGEAEIRTLVKQAVQRQRFRDKAELDVQEVLDFAADLGVMIDPTNAESVQDGLTKVLLLLKQPENGGWGLNLEDYFGTKIGKNFAAGMASHRARQAQLVLDVLLNEPSNFGIDTKTLREIVDKKFGGDSARLKNALLEVLSGTKSYAEAFKGDPELGKLALKAQQKFADMQKFEASYLVGIINQRRRNPNLMDNLKSIRYLSPFEERLGGSDAICFSSPDGGFQVALNPLRPLMNNGFDPKSAEFSLFEPETSVGTEVAKLQAISSSLDRAGAEKIKNEYFDELMNLEALEQRVEQGEYYLQHFIRDNMGTMGQGIYIINHELTHARQILLVERFLKSIPGATDGLTNEQIMELVENLISGQEKIRDVFGRDWDYASILSNPEWLLTAVDNLPEIMQVLLSKNAGGKYAMSHYYQAAFMQPFVDGSISRVQDLLAPLIRLRNQMQTMEDGTKKEAALKVYEEMRKVYETADADFFRETQGYFQQQAALTIAEMQAELAAGVESGFIKKTPEIEAFLGPLNFDVDISPDYGKANPLAKPDHSVDVARLKKDFNKKFGSKFNLRKKRQNRRLIDSAPETIPGDSGFIVEEPGDFFDAVSRFRRAAKGLSSRSESSRANNLVREFVLRDATSRQKEILEGEWRGSIWNSSDPGNWAAALRSRPDQVVNAVEEQFIPFMDLIESSSLPMDMVAEINVPTNSFDTLNDERGTKISVNKHFTAIIHTNEDIEGSKPGLPSEQQGQRMMILVPEGSSGLPDNTPGTQKGEVGALILPPGEIEIIGKTKNNIFVGRVASQKDADTQLNELRRTLHSLGSNDLSPLEQRIVAKRAENRIERRQAAALASRTQTAVAMEVDPRKSKLAQKIEYDPQTQTLKVSYRNGTTREFENVPYGKVRDAGAANRPDDLILQLEKIPREFDADRVMPANRGLRSSTINQINLENESNRANQKTIDILAKANDIGVDMDRQEREIVPRLFEQAKADRLKPETMAAVKRKIESSLTAENKKILRELAEDAKLSDLEILRQTPGGDTFGHRLEVLREIADVRGDRQLVGQIDDFIKEVGAMTPEQYDAAIEEAMGKFESPFDKRATVLMNSPIGLITSGRYETVHQGRATQGGQATGFDVPAIRRAAESQLLNFSGDTDSETTSLRPSSAMTLQTTPSETRARRLRELYGEDIEIQHNAPSAGKEGRQAAHTGTGKQIYKNDSQYGANSIVLRPEVAERTLAINGDSVSDVSTSGSDVIEPGARLSNLSKDGRLASMFFDPLAVLFETRTGRKDTVASAGSNGLKRYVESLTVGSFELSDVESIVSKPFGLRGEHIWSQGEMSMLGANPEASFTNIIAAARQRDDLFEKYGIDVIIDSKELNLDDVEPFNTAMTSKWVDKQISSGEWTDISPKDVIVDEMTTPYEALLRYRKIRAEKGKGTPLFDHPDNESTFDTSPVNQKNFISMVDDELNRLRPESPRRGLASSTAANPRGTISKESDGTLKWVPVPEAPDVVDEDFEKYLENLKIKPQEPRILVKVDTVEEAVMALLDGHDVDVPDVEGAHTLIDDFARMVVTLEKMAAEGQIDKETLSNVVFDLCQITIKGVSIFCLGNKGIPRNLMPQAEGKVVADSPAEKLLEKQNAERLAKGEKVKDEVNASVEFVNFLKEQGLKISDAQYVQSNKLKATQRDMQGQNVAKMLSSAKAGTWNPGASPIFISRDGYVIDGHHRWAAQLGLDFADGILGNNHEMNVRVVDAPISQIMRLANEFTETFGIAKKSVAKKSDQSPSYSKDVLQVVRNNALMGGSGQIDFGNLTSREQQNVVDFAASLPKTRGLSSSTSIDDIFGTPPGRTVGQKLEDGPLELPFGRDELGVPRVETPENLKKKFGYSKGQVRRYFKKNYGIDIEVKKSLFKEMDSFEDGSKRPSLRNNAAYSSLQALDDLLVNTPGMKGLLKDNNFSIEISDGGIEGRMGMFIPDSALGKFTVRAKFFRTTRFREGGKQKTKITVSIHEIDSLADKFFRMEYPFNSGQVRVQNPGQRTESFSVQGGSTVSALGVLNLPPRYRDLDDNQKVEARTEFAGRLAYATMVHEFGHLLDFSMRDKTKLDKLKLPSTMKKFLKSLLSGGEKIDLGGSPEDIYQSALKAQEIERGLAATRYGAEKAAEALAEAFASWFLFARAPKIRVQSGKRIKKTDINGEEVIETLGDLWHQPAKISQDTIFPLLEKLGQNIKSAQIDDPVNLEDLDPLVVAFALMPLLIKNPKSGKIGRRRTRRTNRSEDRRKEFAQT